MTDTAASYATVEEVSKRLGSELTESETEALELFLQDFSAAIRAEFAIAGKDIDNADSTMLNSITANRAVQFMNYRDFAPAGVSQTVGDISSTRVMGSANRPEDLALTKHEKRLLRLQLLSPFNIQLRRG